MPVPVPFENYVHIEEVAALDRLFEYRRDHYTPHQRWAFRGQADAEWGLSSRLERELLERLPAEGLCNALDWELRLFSEFKRRAHHFISPPHADDVVEWLALMQHFGAPTRLLDWTYSFWVAVYFAIEHSREGSVAAVWMIDFDWLRTKVEPRLVAANVDYDRVLRRDPAALKRVFSHREPFVWPVNPTRLNERLSIQQGVFLAQSVLSEPFMANLSAIADPEESKAHIIQLRIPCHQAVLRDFLGELHRMNVNRATLFPGLDGAAQALKHRLHMPYLFQGLADGGPTIWT